jgi:hypothetical protein
MTCGALPIAALAAAAPAQGSVTIGHVLGTGTPGPIACFPTCTLRQVALAPEDGRATAGLTSPVNGVVTRFGFGVVEANQAGDLTIRLRVLRGQAGVASSEPLTLRDADGIQTFESELPIAIGDGIGLDTLPSALPGSIGIGRGSAALNSVAEVFTPPLLDGGPSQTPNSTGPGVLDMNAVIEPTNTFSFSQVAADGKGTATVSVKVPNAGALVVAGKGVKRARKSATAPGVVPLKVRATGKARRKLASSSRVKVTAKVTFTPTGGDARSRSKRLTLKRR